MLTGGLKAEPLPFIYARKRPLPANWQIQPRASQRQLSARNDGQADLVVLGPEPSFAWTPDAASQHLISGHSA